ncbi:hypothetical protein [Vibrio cholerae]|uniref:hypothetical protein n=1 Tax=Vibrio cholerae TaxID=666 RepID=UPI0011F0BEA4|nr:hypothetical protein [Vibrio cholerae]KAA1203506.1 hypothetical protein F0M20_16010 [Vibrio cholerae]GIA50484.1 hypothetical protein VCSRO39_2238 [Vibrio cholerae]
MSLEEAVLSHVSATVTKISEVHSLEGHYVIIGGIALYCHMMNRGHKPIIDTKDADITCSCDCYGALRLIHEVTFNGRLKKHEYKVSLSVNGNDERVDVDVYVCFHHDLQVNGMELIKHAIVVKDTLCAHPLHLLVLKIDSFIDFDGDKTSDKYVKIVHDVLQFLALIQIDDQKTLELAKTNFNQQRLSALTYIVAEYQHIVAAVIGLFKRDNFSSELGFFTQILDPS